MMGTVILKVLFDAFETINHAAAIQQLLRTERRYQEWYIETNLTCLTNHSKHNP